MAGDWLCLELKMFCCWSEDMCLHLDCRFVEDQMGCLNRPPLRHFGRSPVVLVPLTKWGNVTRIGLVLTWPLPIKCHSSGDGFSVIY